MILHLGEKRKRDKKLFTFDVIVTANRGRFVKAMTTKRPTNTINALPLVDTSTPYVELIACY
jgi:hypothetical protein